MDTFQSILAVAALSISGFYLLRAAKGLRILAYLCSKKSHMDSNVFKNLKQKSKTTILFYCFYALGMAITFAMYFLHLQFVSQFLIAFTLVDILVSLLARKRLWTWREFQSLAERIG